MDFFGKSKIIIYNINYFRPKNSFQGLS